MKPASIAAQGLGWVDEQTRAIAPPIHTSTTFLRDPDNQYRSGRIYARDHNPTFDQAEAVLTALEGGHASLLFASGMAAATAVFQALAPGDHVLAPKVMYWSLRNWLMNFATRWGLRVQFIEMNDPDQVRSAVQSDRTKLVWIETPANPLWTITDIAITCEIAHAAGAAVAVDSTVATPVLTRPFELGADIVMHSATKYLNGHSDVIAGTLTAREDSPLWTAHQIHSCANRWCARAVRGVAAHARHANAVSPRSSRMRQCAKHRRALGAASFRRGSALPGFAGLSGSRGRCAANARRFWRHAVDPRAGREKRSRLPGENAAIATAANVQLWKRATSLGGVESLIEHRASIEGAGTPVSADLLRLSVGLEDAEDLIADLEHALAQTHS